MAGDALGRLGAHPSVGGLLVQNLGRRPAGCGVYPSSRGSTAGRTVADQLIGFRIYLATAEADQLKFEEGAPEPTRTGLLHRTREAVGSVLGWGPDCHATIGRANAGAPGVGVVHWGAQWWPGGPTPPYGGC